MSRLLKQRGFLAVEVALLLPVLMFTLLVGLEGLRVLCGEMVLSYALSSTTYQVRIDPALDRNDTGRLFRQRLEQLGFVDSSRATVRVRLLADVSSDAVEGLNNEERLFVVELSYDFDVFSFLDHESYTWRRKVLLQEEGL
ncbi:MAG: hypothetical protein OIF57_01120 [Marinobacterium sp.]|nr:hypothetical protein [Marinobacterium sp.]